MKVLKLIILSIAILANLSTLNANSENGVAKVMKVRGKVFYSQTKKPLAKGDWVPEGAKITTKARSFVKLLFIDKSNLTLGANSEVEVEQFPKKKAGIINLINGQLRSKVSKNYLQIDKKKSKLFIKTKTAAMGVRGTDFQVNYNPANNNTTLITFEGAVAMGSLSSFKKTRFLQDRLEKVVSSPTSVMVRQGQLSGVMPNVDSKPIEPVKINKQQLKALEANDGSKTSSNGDKNKSEKKQMSRNIIPPGMDSSKFSGAGGTEIMGQMAKADSNLKVPTSQAPTLTVTKADPKGTMKEGGFVDTNNALYIPPPKNAPVDPMTNEVIVPVQMGSFDKETGEYKNDFYVVNENGDMIPKNKPQITVNRNPASGGTKPNIMPEEPMNIFNPDGEKPLGNPMLPPVITDDSRPVNDGPDILKNTMDDRDQMLDQTNTTSTNRTRVKVILDRQ
ncbi:sigma factor regulatory protein, FecR/PupR family [Bacteriovorax sp. BAL6_X]|uniref:FecR family protein n=1 Tax=Bacteriovorax sp. BAL6_X TaxID=1201290 RepID=UPI000386827C|nr:FecR family protein [Bacteriovorax sp. BAL6_X]EPZ49920.1 sigma factor regulatory protein, FecR/PupR family [Bacteriovorax sp. BAL6_X]